MSNSIVNTRLTVDAMEQLLGKELPVLDHGFVRVVDYMGGDAAVVQAARVSYGTGTKKVSQDRGLIRYLMRHRHTTPFEMCELKLHVKLPIFVARQWIRHRTASVNEYSARYSILDKEFYVPDRAFIDATIVEESAEKKRRRDAAEGQEQSLFDLAEMDKPDLRDLAAQSVENKQGRGASLDESEGEQALKQILRLSTSSYSTYLKLLNEDEHGRRADDTKMGIARELARMVLPVNYYTQWYWKINLHNLLHFIALRADKHAQAEIRAYADVVANVVKQWAPFTWEAFEDYRQGSAHLSRQEVALLKIMLAGGEVSKESSDLSDREWKEFAQKFELKE